MLGGHPRALSTLFFTEMWERFTFYGMRALLVLFLVDAVESGGYGFDDRTATAIYGLYTAAVFMAMASLASVIKRDLSNMGKFLFVGAILLLVAGVINIFVLSSALMVTLSVIAIGLFSAFMLYDIKRVIDGGETNYVTATLAIYLDIYNVFQSLLALLGIFGGERE